MQSDSLVRVLLTLILLCLVVIAAQGFGVGFGAEREAIGDPRDLRFHVEVLRLRNRPMFLRMDTATGRVWRTPISGAEPWLEVGDGLKLAPGEPLRPGRFSIRLVRSGRGPFLLRMDQETGRLWRMPLSGEDRWTAIGQAAASLEDVPPGSENFPQPLTPLESAEGGGD